MEHSANWARTFGGSDTNLTQRYRHNQDLTDYAQALQQQREVEQERLIQTNKAAQSLYFGQQKIDLAERLANQKMRFDAEVHPLKLQAEEQRFKTQQALEQRALREQALQDRVVEHEAKFQAGLATFEADYPDASDAEKDDYILGLRTSNPLAVKVEGVKALTTEAARRKLEREKVALRPPAKTDAERIAFEVDRKKALDAALPAKTDADSYDRLAKDRENAKAIRPELTPEQTRQFNKREQALITAGRQQTTPSATTGASAPTPRMDRARMALDDPEATAEEKAAARRILGQ